MTEEVNRNSIISSINPKLNVQPKLAVKNFNPLSIGGFLQIGKTFSLFIWYFIRSFFSIIYTKKKKIRNQFVLITGSGGYLGRQLACEFSKHGCSLILWDINEEDNKKTYDALRALGHRRMYLYKVDLTNESDVRENAKKVIEKHGLISTVILAAGTVGDCKSVLFKTSEQLTKAFELFYLSHVWMYQEFLPSMIEKNQGHLVCISSESVFVDPPMAITYASLKAAQTKLLECVDSELNSNSSNQIKSSIVYLGLLKGGLATQFAQMYNVEENLINKMGLNLEKAAASILKQIVKNRKYIYVSKRVYLVQLMKCILPTACFDLLCSPNSYLELDLVTNPKKAE